LNFEASIALDDMWIDGPTLRYLNTLRTNVFTSASNFDDIHLKA